ncbi:MAG: Stp1/IreP family PP2C-type Ser/Thr phosphatase [Actinobacteria bacterium]|nr:Stp1/IreP family PP2C-type Ser/Thr phosphatase [Actinomycetota bacterium]
MIKLVSSAATHLGLVRRQNEDSYVVTEDVFAVCDGMGGARAGEVASEVACRVLQGVSAEAGVEGLRNAVNEANRLIRDCGAGSADLSGMGTTLTAAIASAERLTIAQVGDSRAYLMRSGALSQITDDHSLVAQMVRHGQLTPEQAAVHPHRSIITRALGTEAAVSPDFFEVELAHGDRILLCSDGLSGMVPEDELSRILAEEATPRAVARSLIEAALRQGGEDNITAVVLFAVDDEIAPLPEDDEEATDGVGSDSGVAGASGTAGASPMAGTSGAAGTPGAATASSAIAAATAESVIAPPGFGPLVRGVEVHSVATRAWHRRPLVMLLLIVLVAAFLLGAFLLFNSSVYFVGTSDGHVALYNGMPYSVFGFELYSVVEKAPAVYADLAPHLKQRVDAHGLLTKEEGQRFIRGLGSAQ